MSQRSNCLCLFLSLAALTGINAQDSKSDPVPPPPMDGEAILERCLGKMAKLASVTFRTTEGQDDAMQRMMAKQAGGLLAAAMRRTVKGEQADAVLSAEVNSNEVLMHAGRMLVRTNGGDWHVRRGRMLDGSDMPFILEPRGFFENLQTLPKAKRKVRRAVAAADGRVVLNITLDGDAAQDFGLSGALPKVSSSMGISILGGLGLPGANHNPPEMTIDLALVVDPKTGYVHRVKTQTYQESKMPGNVQIAVGGMGGGNQEDEEEVEEEETKARERGDDGNRIYKSDLPVRHLDKDMSRMTFDIRFEKHGMPIDLKMDQRCREHLRIPGSK